MVPITNKEYKPITVLLFGKVDVVSLGATEITKVNASSWDQFVTECGMKLKYDLVLLDGRLEPGCTQDMIRNSGHCDKLVIMQASDVLSGLVMQVDDELAQLHEARQSPQAPTSSELEVGFREYVEKYPTVPEVELDDLTFTVTIP